MSDEREMIPLDKLREACDQLLDYLERNAGQEIVINKEAFWSIPSENRYDMCHQPELTIGVTSESWGNLASMVDGDSELVGYGMVWLAQVLHALGDDVV